MKRYLLTFILLISCIFAFTNISNAALTTNFNKDTGSYLLTRDLGKNEKFQTGKYATLSFDKVTAYCVDPGSKPVTKVGMECPATVISDNDFATAAKYILSAKSGEPGDKEVVALRLVAIATGYGKLSGISANDEHHRVNVKCGYINAAFQAAEKAGYPTNKMDGLKSFKSASNTGKLSCYNDFKVDGSAVIDLAAEALKATKNPTNNAASVKPTAKVTTKNGKATLVVDNKNGTKDVEVNISCDANTTGGCGQQTVFAGTVGTYVLTSKTNDSTQCGTFKATMTYESANATGCLEVTKYNCDKNGSDLQDYVGCSKKGDSTNPGDGNNPGDGKNGKVTETIKDPNGGGDTIHIKCDDKKKECPYNDSQVEAIGNGDGLCDANGKEVIKIGEAALYTQDVEDCIIGNDKFLVASSANNVCKTYCVEDYSFESDGLLLSSQDKQGDTFTITAGSYFKFENPNPKATEKGVVKCYTKLDLQSFAANVETTAQKSYADYMTTEKHSCSCKTDENNITTCTDVVTRTEYKAQYSNNKVTFVPYQTGTTNYPSSCSGISDIESTADSYKETYKGQIDALIKELDNCVKTASAGNYFDQECNSKVEFDYGFNMDPIVLTAENKQANSEINYKSNCNGDYSKCSSTQKDNIPEANLDLGIGTSLKYPALEYIEKIATITAEYHLKGVGICNNYNEGTSSYLGDGKTTKNIEEAECLADKGATWDEGWPIKYDTPQGNYSYQITVSNFGHIKQSDKCKTLDHYLDGKSVSFACPYKVNGCEECTWSCNPNNNCDYQDCDQECIYKCAGVGCIYDSGNGLALNYQPISMINVDSSFAYLGDRYSSVATLSSARNTAPKATKLAATATHRSIDSINWGTEKGQATLDVIEDKGETIYSGTPEYKVTLTPTTINNIKKQNSEISDGFLNKSLECEVVDSSKEYVTCTSKFLDDLRTKGILEGEAKFESVDEINNYITGYNVVSARKSGTGPAWK